MCIRDRHRTSTKFVLLLTDDWIENHVNIGKELLDQAIVDENFLKNTGTGDETWVYSCDVETNAQTTQWVEKGSHPPATKSLHESDKHEGDGSSLMTRLSPLGIHSI